MLGRGWRGGTQRPPPVCFFLRLWRVAHATPCSFSATTPMSERQPATPSARGPGVPPVLAPLMYGRRARPLGQATYFSETYSYNVGCDPVCAFAETVRLRACSLR